MSAPLPGFSNFLVLSPSLCDPQWRSFRKIPHDTGGKYPQFWYLVLMPLSIHTMLDALDRTLHFLLVSTWEVLSSLPTGRLLTRIRGNLSLLVRYWNLHHQTSVLVFPHTFPYQGSYNYFIVPWTRRAIEWCQHPMDKLWCHTGE